MRRWHPRQDRLRPLCGRWLPIGIVLLGVGTCATVRADGGASWLERLRGPRAVAELSAPDSSVRQAAAETLARHGDASRAVEALTSALGREQDPAVRRTIVLALARRGALEAVPALIEALRGGVEVNQPVIARALAGIGTDQAIAALVDALDARETASVAYEALGRVGVRAIPHLVRATRDSSATVLAVRALGEIGSALAIPRIVELSADRRAPVRLAAMEALGRIGDPRVGPAVAARLEDRSPAVVLGALNALASVGRPSERQAIRAWLDQGSDAHRRAALRALVLVDPEAGAAALHDVARTEQAERVTMAAELAFEVRHPAFVPLLEGFLREGTRASHAASALADVDDGRGVPVLIEEAHRIAARSRSLVAVTRALAVALRRWRQTLEGDVLARGRETLRSLTDPRSARGLVLRALATDPESGPLLVSALASPDPALRAAAALGLELLAGKRHAGSLERALIRERYPEAFRRMASAAMRLEVAVRPLAYRSRLLSAATAPEAMALAAASREATDRHGWRELRELFRRQLWAEEARVRAGAARALAVARDREAWRALVRRLDDRAAEVRYAAARALEVLAVERAVPAIEARRRVEPHPGVRDALERAASAPERRPLEGYDAPGRQTLRVRIVSEESGREGGTLLDVVLPDGRWLRTRSLATGELILADLPAGQADVRVRVAP